jgi:predicted RNA-binding protein with TRAM domain
MYSAERDVVNIQQALLDIESGYVVLDPPLPSGVLVDVAIQSTKSSATGAFIAGDTVVRVHHPLEPFNIVR